MGFLLQFKMIFYILRNKSLTFKDFCIAYHILLSTVGIYYLTHIEGHTEGDIFYLYIIRKVVLSTSAHVCYIKIHAN